MKLFLKYPLNTIRFFLRYLISLFPKKKNLWIFGAWFGDKYGDNSKYFFEYVNKNHPEIKAIWITRKKEVKKLIEKKGFKAEYSFSARGIWHILRSEMAFVTTGLHDINPFFLPYPAVNLWHGDPIKTIGQHARKNQANSSFLKPAIEIIKKIYSLILKKITQFPYMITSNKEIRHIFVAAFNLKKENVWITGLPRNEVFFKKPPIPIDIEGYKIIYMPTHRLEGRQSIASVLENSLDMLEKEMERINGYLFIKLHFYHLTESNIIQKLKQFKRIKILEDSFIQQDIYTVINNFDLLITDYSSIVFDWLLSEKPVILFPFDFDDYLNKDRELYFDYKEIAPGPVCMEWDEVVKWIANFKENSNLYSDKIIDLKNRFHQYHDGNFSQRVWAKVKQTLEDKKGEI